MTQNKAQKAAVRQRMAATGEPYSVARHAVDQEREAGGPRPRTAQARTAQARTAQRRTGTPMRPG